MRKNVRKKKKQSAKQWTTATKLSNALIIRAKEGKSYSNIFRKVKQDVFEEKIEDSIQKVCRTNTGQLLIVLDKRNGAKTDELRKMKANRHPQRRCGSRK